MNEAPTFNESKQGWEALAREAARQRESAGDLVDLQQFLTFTLDGAPYAIPVERVREIVRIRPITPVPRLPDDVRGVISLRGEIVEVVDLRRRLGLTPTEPGRRSRIIVVHGSDGSIAGLLVDGVTEVLSVDESALRAAAGDSGAVESLCVRDDEFVSLVDLDRVLEVDGDE
jgi:purine-binding chemotaxis protein CheW